MNKERKTISLYRLEKAKDALASAQRNFADDDLFTAANRLY